MKDQQSPFLHFTNDKAATILRCAEESCVDEVDAVVHLAACLVALSPHLKTTLGLIEYIDSQGSEDES